MPADDLPLPTLLSQLLIAFTRVLTECGVRVRDLPDLTGVSKEALSMAAGVLARASCAVTEPDPSASRGKLVRLTAKGRSAQDGFFRLLGATEQRWRERFGPSLIGALRRSLRSVIDQRDGGGPRLALGLRPYPDGWRARNPYLRHTTNLLADPSGALPHYPMVLHRGGWPDGS